MKIVISHPHGNQNTNRAVSLLEKLNLLDSFWTTIAIPFNLKYLKKRHFSGVRFKKIRLNLIKELLRKFFEILNLKKFYHFEQSIFSTYSVYKDLDIRVSKYIKSNTKNIDAIYSYEDCALNSFEVAKKIGIKTIYDLTSPYWILKEKLLKEEVNLQPQWNLTTSEISSIKKNLNKDKEILLSDQIIVASNFSARSLKYFKKKDLNIKIIPYGCPKPIGNKINRRSINEKLKIIFAGRLVLSKGIQYLIESLYKTDLPWVLEIAGSCPEPPEQISKILSLFLKDSRCKFLGQISNDNLLERMRNCHVLMLPSLYEGFGQVLLEAISCGLPVITTENTGGLDFIKNGYNGFITPIRDTQKTIEILEKIYHNEDFRVSIAENSIITAKEFSWERYDKQIEIIIKE
jgi:starch synthase